MGLLCVGQLMIVLDSTVVNVALPVIQAQLHFSQASLAWVVNGYLLTFGGLLLLAGRLGDLIGRAQVFLTGLTAFVVSSALCGLAPSSGFLVASRVVQGASAAMIASMVLGIITPMFPSPRERTLALSVFAFVAVGGGSLGLVLGGVITELLSWHWIFFINLPLGAVVLIAAFPRLERTPGIGIREGADLLGAVLVTGAPTLAVYGVINAGTASWISPLTVGALLAALVCAVLFVVVEARVETPLIPLSVFRHRDVTSAAMVRLLFPMGGFGINFLGALYLEKVLGYSPLRTGLAFLPSSALTGVISLLIIPKLVRRFPLKPLIQIGLVLLTLSLLAFTRIGVHSHFVSDVMPTMVLMGIAFGFIFMPSVAIAMSSVSPSEAGIASALTNVAVQLGGSIGVALMATISASRIKDLLVRHESLKAALTGGYRLGVFAGAACTTASLLVASVMLRSAPPPRPDDHAEAVSYPSDLVLE
jgi:EmrB/QacA subfamily drug resistance transporter